MGHRLPNPLGKVGRIRGLGRHNAASPLGTPIEADLPIDAGLVIPGEELSVATSRSGGPGGQHVNTTESRVSLRWNVQGTTAISDEAKARLVVALGSRLTDSGDIIVHVSTERSQLSNREIARERLAGLVRTARIPKVPRRKTKPSFGSKLRRLDAKKQRGDRLRSRRSGGEDG